MFQTSLIGKAFIYASVIFLLISLFILLINNWNKRTIQNNIALTWIKYTYLMHFLMLFFSTSLLILLLITNSFEFYYVWEHTNKMLSNSFLISALWAGQEGSLLLWILFQAFFGLFIIFSKQTFPKFSFIIMMIANLLLLSMVLGIDIGNFTMGASPFTLLKDHESFINSNLAQNLSLNEITSNGIGLNPLLQNIWMSIHPPVLFFGYASLIIPFIIGISMLFNSTTDYINRFRKWLLLSILLLGLGIALGGFWAYEALSFNGFWSWDPVENSSLVPWIILIASLHLVNLENIKSKANKMAAFLAICAFILINYSAFLTRSGILSNVSVHAFAQSKTNIILSTYMLSLCFFLIAIIVIKIKGIKRLLNSTYNLGDAKNTRYIIGLLMLLSAFQILLGTSLPVINKFLSLNIKLTNVNIQFYNNWQLLFILLMFLIYIYYNFKNTIWSTRYIYLIILISFITTLSIILINFIYPIESLFYNIVIATIIIGTSLQLIKFFKMPNKITQINKIIAHFGFSIFLIGCIISFNGKADLIKNKSAHDFLHSDNTNLSNIKLKKGVNVNINNMNFTFLGDSVNDNKVLFKIKYTDVSEIKDSSKVKIILPSLIKDSNRGNVNEPYIFRNFLNDMFVNVIYSSKYDNQVSNEAQLFSLNLNDTLNLGKIKICLDSIHVNTRIGINKDTVWIIEAEILQIKSNSTQENIIHFEVQSDKVKTDSIYIKELDADLSIQSLPEIENSLNFIMKPKPTNEIIMQAWEFPLIYITWLGLVLIFLSLILSLIMKFKSFRTVP